MEAGAPGEQRGGKEVGPGKMQGQVTAGLCSHLLGRGKPQKGLHLGGMRWLGIFEQLPGHRVKKQRKGSGLGETC